MRDVQQSLHEVAHASDGHLGITQRLGLGLLAAGHFLRELQQLLPQLLDGLGTVDQGGGIHIDVVNHIGVGQLVAGDLDDGGQGIAGGGAAAGGEHHNLGAAGHHAATEEGSLPGVSMMTRPCLASTCLA